MSDLLSLDATGQLQALETRRVSAVELLEASAVRNRAQEFDRPFPSTRILGVPRAFLEHHRPDALLAEIGLDPEGLANAFSRLLNDKPEFPRVLPESPQPRFY